MLYNVAAARVAAHDGAPVIAVEGYVDVIAMVDAGFAATVAPLGTALTAEQLGLLWKMADEPILCFDGDGAGRRAAYRAVDLALPLLRPGKSLLFAALPEGQDPDDLVRSGGREAIDDVLAARASAWRRCCGCARPKAGRFDTPERRAGLEARHWPRSGRRSAMNPSAAIIGRSWRAGCGAYLRAMRLRRGAFRAGASAQCRRNAARPIRHAGRRGRRPARQSRGGPYLVASPQLAASPMHRGNRAGCRRARP